jgi:hypothetical protein
MLIVSMSVDVRIFVQMSIGGELLGTPNAEMRGYLTDDQPRLFTPWLALSDEPAPAE